MIALGYRLSAATGTHKGDRAYQQDQVMLFSHPRVKGCILAVLADGMGGRSGGRKASDQVMMTAKQLFERYLMQAHTVIKLTALSSEEEPHSTLAACLIHPGGDCYWAHVGDSRIYHFHGQRLVYRTLDHSYVQTLVDRGEISAAEASFHPQSNILMGCLGAEKDPPAAHHFIPRLKPGDILMACSDGLWHYFSDLELGSVLANLSPRDASEFLIEKARVRAKGIGDNLSLVIIKLEPLQPQEMEPE